MRVILFVILVAAGVGLSTFTYSYGSAPHNTDLISAMILPTITAGDSVTFNLEFFKDTGYSPTSIYIALGDISFNFISPTPAGFSTDTSIVFNTSMPFSFTAATTQVYSYFLNTYYSLSSLVPFYHTISNSNGSQISKHVNIVRGSKMFKLIYLNNAQDTSINCTSGTCDLISMATDPSNFKLDSTVTPSSTSGTTKTYTALAAGYYALQLTSSSLGTLTY